VALFAENPGNGIHDVGFTAAVWPDDAGRAGPAERNYGALAKRLKANDFHFSQLQQDVPFLVVNFSAAAGMKLEYNPITAKSSHSLGLA